MGKYLKYPMTHEQALVKENQCYNSIMKRIPDVEETYNYNTIINMHYLPFNEKLLVIVSVLYKHSSKNKMLTFFPYLRCVMKGS